MNTDGWQRELVERHEPGCSPAPATRPTWPTRCSRCATTRRSPTRLGRSARRLAEEEFDRRLLAERLRSVLESVA